MTLIWCRYKEIPRSLDTVSSTTADTYTRRYDVDWLRIIALGLLVIYHVVLSFQPWATRIYFIQNEQSLQGLWVLMAAINVWRIPILFLISGMGVYFAMDRRNWKQLLKDRVARILVPFIFGFFFICPISLYFALKHYGKEVAYVPNPGHLWFLGNLFLYILLLLLLLTYIKNNPSNFASRFLSRLLQQRFGIFFITLPLMAEYWLVGPQFYATYALTPHGFWLGMVCFFTGFILISLGDVFWYSVKRVRRVALLIAILLYLVRLGIFKLTGESNFLIALESMSWMLAMLGCGAIYLNKASGILAYLSKAVYPVYIVHMPVQYCISYFLLPLNLPAILKLIMLLIGTFGTCLLIHEFVISRFKWLQPLFGMKLRRV